MKKFKVTSYHKSNALTSTNGGTLIITDTEYIIKYLFITVAKYKIDDSITGCLTEIKYRYIQKRLTAIKSSQPILLF